MSLLAQHQLWDRACVSDMWTSIFYLAQALPEAPETYLFPILKNGPYNQVCLALGTGPGRPPRLSHCTDCRSAPRARPSLQKRDLRKFLAVAKELGCGIVLTGEARAQ